MNLIKQDALKNLTINDIQEQILCIRKEIIFMKVKQKTQQTIKSHELKNKKHKLVQLLTIEKLKLKNNL